MEPDTEILEPDMTPTSEIRWHDPFGRDVALPLTVRFKRA
jgi:hypothetical protein